MNIKNLMEQANRMQQNLEKTQKEIDLMEFTGKSQLVEVIINGQKKIKKINISQTILSDNDDIEMLEDMIVLALNDAISQVDKITEEKMGKYGKGLKGLI